MIDIKLVRENPELVKENIKKKFQDEKLVLVDEVIELDKEFRASKAKGDELRAEKNKISKQIGMFMGKGLKEEAENDSIINKIYNIYIKSNYKIHKE